MSILTEMPNMLDNLLHKAATLIGVAALLAGPQATAQIASCDPEVPYSLVDLTGNPDTTWTVPSLTRDGQCCGAPSNHNCASFEIVPDANVAAITFDVLSGAEPVGSMYFYLYKASDPSCGTSHPVGTEICLSTSAEPWIIVFCKPGSNDNTYGIRSISKPIAPADDSIRVGCSKPLQAYGFDPASVTWNSVYPGSPGDFNHYLSATSGTLTPSFSPDASAPSTIRYEICGLPSAQVCGYPSTCKQVELTVFNELLVSVSPAQGGLCQPGATVDLTAHPVGGDGNYTVTWLDAGSAVVGSGTVFTASAAGTYHATVQDGIAGCPAASESVEVVMSALSASTVASDVSCAGGANGSINLTIAGGVAPLTYAWTGPSGFSANTEDISGLSAGNYALTVTDALGCSVMESVSINEPAALSLSVAADTVTMVDGCDGSLTAVVAGGTPPFSFAWSTSPVQTGATASGLCVGAWSVTVTDAQGCVISASADVSNPYCDLSATIASAQDVSCFDGADGSALAAATGGYPPYTYAWSQAGVPVGSMASLTGVAAGTYDVQVTDSRGCTDGAAVSGGTAGCARRFGHEDRRQFPRHLRRHGIRQRHGWHDALHLSVERSRRIDHRFGFRPLHRDLHGDDHRCQRLRDLARRDDPGAGLLRS